METLLIIGGTGSLGYNLVGRLLTEYKIVIVSRDENKQWQMKKLFPGLVYLLGDIRNKTHMASLLLRIRPHKIILAAALKHIDICEQNIAECIATNVIGVQNVLDLVVEHSSQLEVNTVVFISTDKATSPANTYGMSKAICERMVAEKSLYVKSPRFLNVRYGNVLNSRGSLFPLFHEIGKDPTCEFFPLTSPEMTRFFMSLNDSIDLILTAIREGESGDTFIPKTTSYRLLDIAERFSQRYSKPVKVIGMRPGEKLHESLISDSECYRTVDKTTHYVIKPCYNVVVTEPIREYSSKDTVCCDKEQICRLVTQSEMP